jgi:hypothetical protein
MDYIIFTIVLSVHTNLTILFYPFIQVGYQAVILVINGPLHDFNFAMK